MSPAEKTPDSPVPSPTPLTPEDAVSARIKALKEKLVSLEKEVMVAQGRFANRDPQFIRKLMKENGELGTRQNLLEKALFLLLTDDFKPRNPEDEKFRYEVFRQATVDYCKKTNVDHELWKNLES